jgi:hypothetical protein
MNCTNEGCQGELFVPLNVEGQPSKPLMFSGLEVDVLICPVCRRVHFFKNEEATNNMREKQRRTTKGV